MVYFALHYTSATNGTLIYTTPPILIMLIEAIWRGRHISGREIVGICLAVAGVFVIVFRGEAENLASFDFNDGDLIFIAAAVSWPSTRFFSRPSRSSRLILFRCWHW